MTRIATGVVDQGFYFVAVDSTDFTTRETGLATFTVWRERNNGTAAAMTTPTITEASAANMPGVYFLLCDEDMAIDSGDETQEMAYHITHAGMAPVTQVVELYRPKITVGNTLGVAADGDISGNVDGAVASVTGAVGSVTGNVGGNVVGSVASVTGAVGSVTGNVGGNVSGNVTGSVGSVVGAVGGAVASVTGNVGGNVTGSIGSLAAQAKTDVNLEVQDVMNTDTTSEMGAGAPPASPSLRVAINYIYRWMTRNKKTVDRSASPAVETVFADDGTTPLWKRNITDAANVTTFDESAAP